MKIYRFDEIDSTNTFLKRREDLVNYDMAITKVQTAGRGRRGNDWKSPVGASLFSFALKEEKYLPMEEYRKLPLVVGISVLKALSGIEGGSYEFKWTNDVYLAGKKISGILVEKVEGFFIIGIGINVNNNEFGELAHKATSLGRETGKNYDTEEIALRVIEEFRGNYSKFLMGGWTELLYEINSKNYLKNKGINIDLRNRIEKGIARDINEDGTLQVEVEGEIKKYDVGEIHISFEG